jgi:hypothetical protein
MLDTMLIALVLSLVVTAGPQQEGHWYEIFLNHPTEWLLVIFNGVLVLYMRRLYEATSGLFSETAGLRTAADKQSSDMQASIRAAVESAKASVVSNRIAVSTSQEELRAYVTALDVDMVQHRSIGPMGSYGNQLPGKVNLYEFCVILKNGGQTPAINVRTNINLQRFDGDVPPDFDFPSSELFGYGLIGPRVEWRTRYYDASAALIEEIGPAVLLWGWIEYDDIFVTMGGIKNRTEFCFRVERRRLPVTNELWIGFIPHDRFNAADADCLRSIDPATGEGGG